MVKELTPRPPKEELEQLYVRDCLAMCNLAGVYGCSAFVVRGWLHEYNIPVNVGGGILPIPPKEAFEQHVVACGMVPTKTHLYRKLGEIYECSISTIAKWFRVHELDADPYILPKFSEKETLERLFVYESLSIEDIAKIYNRSIENTKKWLGKYDLLTPPLPPDPPQMPPEEEVRRHIQSRGDWWSAKRIYDDIASFYGCSPLIIREWVQFYGIDRDFRPFPPTKETLEHLYRDKRWSIADIMEYHDKTGYAAYNTIRSLLIEHGITLKMGTKPC